MSAAALYEGSNSIYRTNHFEYSIAAFHQQLGLDKLAVKRIKSQRRNICP